MVQRCHRVRRTGIHYTKMIAMRFCALSHSRLCGVYFRYQVVLKERLAKYWVSETERAVTVIQAAW